MTENDEFTGHNRLNPDERMYRFVGKVELAGRTLWEAGNL